METRITIAAFLITLGSGIVLGVFEIMQDWKMPSQIAIVIVAISGVAALIGLGIVMHGAWVQTRPFRAKWRIRNFLYRRDVPIPHQWLLDIAEKQWDNPTSHLVITDRIIMGVHLDDRRPRLQLRVTYTNFGVHNLVMSQPEGYPYFGYEKSEYYKRDEGGQISVPAGHTASSFSLDIYIDAEFLDDVRSEIDSSSGELRGITLGQVRAMVRAGAEGAPSVGWGLGGPGAVFRPNR